MEKHDIRQRVEALICSNHAIDIALRGTGRTTRELDKICDGDAVICAVSERQLIERHCRQYGRRVQVMAPKIEDFLRGDIRRGAKDFHFTHEFVKQWLEYEVWQAGARIEKTMEMLQRPASERYRELSDVFNTPSPILEMIPFTDADSGTISGRVSHKVPNPFNPEKHRHPNFEEVEKVREPSTFSELAAQTFNER